MKIAILGFGYIGSALVDLYRGSKHEITVIDAILPYHKLVGRPNIKFVQSTIQNCDSWNLQEFDIVYNLIGIPSTKSGNDDLVFDVNCKYAKRVAELSKRYIFASSCNVFSGNKENKLFTENDEPHNPPASEYGKQKREVEMFLKETHKDYIICRFGANYGYSPGLNKKAPVGNTFLLNTLFNETISVHKMEETRPMCHVRDSARALWHLAHSDNVGIYHVASNNYKLGDLAKMLKNRYNKDVTLLLTPSQPSGYAVSNQKIKDTGFKFKYNFDTAYREFAELFKSVKVLN